MKLTVRPVINPLDNIRQLRKTSVTQADLGILYRMWAGRRTIFKKRELILKKMQIYKFQNKQISKKSKNEIWALFESFEKF